ncbi:hypothetical protein ACLB1G_04450 [Oxalobacteraceae bacterium A2-2]
MNRFVITYQSIADPSGAQEDDLLSALGDAIVVDRFPGTLMVEGNAALLAGVIMRFDRWTLSPVVRASVAPPHRNMSEL